MMELTRSEAIEQHRDMWDRIFRYCNERYDSKTVPNAKKIKRTILREMNGGRMPVLHSDCYLCEYAYPEGCQKCPLEWGILCYVKGGLFQQFCQAKNYKEAAYFALWIRDLRERIERDERETPMLPDVKDYTMPIIYTCKRCGEKTFSSPNETINYCWNCGQRFTEREERRNKYVGDVYKNLY